MQSGHGRKRNALHVDNLDSRFVEKRRQFIGRQELVPIMRAARDLSKPFVGVHEENSRRWRVIWGL